MKIGRPTPSAGAARARSMRRPTRGARFTRRLRATSGAGRPSGGTRRASPEVVRVHGDRLAAERAEVAHEAVPARLVRVAQARASFSVTYTGNARPVVGSAYEIVMPPTSGKLRSQTGSWITTGTSSHRCSSAPCQTRRSGGTRKSESTKTNACVGRSRRCSPRNSRPRETVSSGAANARSNGTRLGACLAARRAPVRLALRVVEIAGEAARGVCAQSDQIEGGRESRAACRAGAAAKRGSRARGGGRRGRRRAAPRRRSARAR